jgi:hypothetical protein
MAYVVGFAVAVFLMGVVFIAALSVRAYRQVKAFGIRVAEASERIAEATTALETVAPRER